MVGEGAATLVLEERAAARARGAHILAEVVGYGTNCDGGHLTAPDVDGMEAVMRLALADAGLAPARLDYVNAHATATELGDVAESQATRRVFGARVAGELAEGPPRPHARRVRRARGVAHRRDAARGLGRADPLPRTTSDPRCARLDYVTGAPRGLAAEHAVSNNFAFGGVNTSLVFRLG